MFLNNSNLIILKRNYNFAIGLFMKIVVELERCSGSSNCATDEEINSYISGNYVQLAILNSYYDETKLDSPIQYYIDDTLLFDLNERPIIKYVIFLHDCKYEGEYIINKKYFECLCKEIGGIKINREIINKMITQRFQ